LKPILTLPPRKSGVPVVSQKQKEFLWLTKRMCTFMGGKEQGGGNSLEKGL
jgi:hypothetical protein